MNVTFECGGDHAFYDYEFLDDVNIFLSSMCWPWYRNTDTRIPSFFPLRTLIGFMFILLFFLFRGFCRLELYILFYFVCTIIESHWLIN